MNRTHDLLRTRRLAALLFACIAIAGCSARAVPENTPGPQTAAPTNAPAAPLGFVNRVWTVRRSSSVEPGSMYVFLSGGTLVLTSPHGTPAFGSWKDEAGVLTLVEESRPYPAEIVTLGAEEFHLRIHGPGEAVDLNMVPAESPPRAQ